MEKMLKIGIIPYLDDGVQHIPKGYIKGIHMIGGEEIMIRHETPLDQLEAIVDGLDGMLFSGGVDVDPSCYGVPREPECGPSNSLRDALELKLLEICLRKKMPILGICRGCQVINVAFGGTLVQDIPTTYHVSHRQEKDGAPFSHNVLITAGTMLHRIIGKTVLATNSYHHQCVKELAPGLIPNAYAAEGFIEGFEGAPDGPFLLAVQWHPEVTLDDDEDSIKPFAAFMDAVRAYMAVPCHG